MGAQMYTLQSVNSAELAEACKRVKAIDYDGVQLSGVVEVAGDEMRKILDDTRIGMCGGSSTDSINNTARVIRRHQR